EQRVLQSVVIDLDGDDEIEFARYSDGDIDRLDEQAVRSNLIDSGLWTALRTRPFSKVPAIDARPHSIFVTAMDTHPLAVDPVVVIDEHRDDFARGLRVLARIAPVIVCHAEGTRMPCPG